MESFANDLSQMQRTPLQADHVEAPREVGTIRTYGAGDTIIRPVIRWRNCFILKAGR